MTIKECIDTVFVVKPHEYTVSDQVKWLSFIEAVIINEVLKTHEGYDGRHDDFIEYSPDNTSVELIVPSPYDRLYTAFLTMKIDETNGEMAKYNVSASLYNSYMMEYRKYYNKTHMPLNPEERMRARPPFKAQIGLSDAEFENLKKILFHMLSEVFADMTSRDKLYDIVKNFALNNIEMLKGRDGTVSFDYLTDEQKESLRGEAFTYEDFTPEQLEGLRGEQGIQGERGFSGVYVGGGDMPEGYNVQIDPDGDSYEVYTRAEIDEMVGNIEELLGGI